MENYTEHTIEELAKEAAGNWRKFSSYGRGKDDNETDPVNENWTVVYTATRDSKPYEQSNAAVIARELEAFGDDVRDESASHWAVGYVEGHAIRVYRADGSITDAFRKYVELQIRIEDELYLDSEDASEREYDIALDLAEADGHEWQDISESEQDRYLDYARQ